MKRIIFILILLLIFCCTNFSCTKKSPSEPTTFILEVDNRTPVTFKIYVDDNFAGDSEANTKKEMGSFDNGDNTHLEARFDTLTVFETYQDTRQVAKYIMVLQM